MDQRDRLDLALQRVREAMERVCAAWPAESLDLPVPAPEPPPPAWHPDPDQAPVTTRQWAELSRLRAAALCQHALHISTQANHIYHETKELHALLQRPVEQDGPDHFIRMGRAISLSCAGRDRR